MSTPERDELVELLWRAGFVAADEDADDLIASSAGDRDRLDGLVARRLTGEPIAWIVGSTMFCGLEIRVDAGVYVPRWQTEPLARRAAHRLPGSGIAVDLCTGSGAIARVLASAHPKARVVASDIDARAVECARTNGIESFEGDLFEPIPLGLRGQVDVVVGVVPYVPTASLVLLQRDTFAFESSVPYDGGHDGADILRRVLAEARVWLRAGGALILELGGEQADALAPDIARLGYIDVRVIVDEEGDPRGIETTFDGGSGGPTAP